MQPNVKEVKIVEVGLRDGLQNERVLIETPKKLELLNKLSKTGLKFIEITAFVSPKWIPSLYDHEKILESYKKKRGYVSSFNT
jgi:hydroxymethylglutaryl-CoA lyase